MPLIRTTLLYVIRLMSFESPLREASECKRETAPVSAAASNSLSHLGSFTHTFPTGMEPLQPAAAQRTANGGQRTRFHMAANARRIFSAFIWIITLVSSSRTRIYPPNEGECGGTSRRVRGFLHAGRRRCVRSVRVRGRMAKEQEELCMKT